MRKLIIVLLVLIPFISNCAKDEDSSSLMDIRLIAWNYLSEQAKSTVIVNWKQASVIKTTYDEKSAYAVTFNTSYDELLGPITVYVDSCSKVVLGQCLRD
jgi:hypothetical protein